MGFLFGHLTEWVLAVGPALLFILAAAETGFVTGLVVPGGIAAAFGAFLAHEGVFELRDVILMAGSGAVLGDTIGFWLGRRFGQRLLEGDAWIFRVARRHEARAAGFFRRDPIYAVSFARVVSFVRTLMPFVAGMSPLTYARFLVYDLLGVVGWGSLYIGGGYLAGESWEAASEMIGTGGAVILTIALVVGWILLRRGSRKEGGAEGEGAALPSSSIGEGSSSPSTTGSPPSPTEARDR